MITYSGKNMITDIYFDKVVTFCDAVTEKCTDIWATYGGCIFVDIDGTIADNKHRSHYVEKKPKNHTKYNELMEYDTPITDIIEKVRTLYDCGWKVVMCTGRPDSHRDVTTDWLYKNDVPYNAVYMRKAGDKRQDYVVKAELLEQAEEDGFTPTLVIEDRTQVVDMWRSKGVRCIQVAPGDF